MINIKDIPVDEGTTVLSEQRMTIGHLDVVLQTWILDGIKASSYIFNTAEISELGDDELKAWVKNTGIVSHDSLMTMRRANEFTFVNFNFDY